MKRLSLNHPLDYIYSVIDDNVLGIKSCVIGLCSDIDRYFKLRFGVNISHEVNEKDFNYIKTIFPKFANMSFDLFKRFLTTFACIRRINAHLHLCEPIYIDEDVEKYLSNVLAPIYKVSQCGKVTAYGQAYILNFLSQKYNIFPFITSYYKHEYFVEISKMSGKEKKEFFVSQQHLIQDYCGIGKPIRRNEKNTKEWQGMNDLFKRHLTRIIYSLEKESLNTEKSYKHALSISKGLSSLYCFQKDPSTLDLIVFLRNCWFHGINLGDEVDFNGRTFELDYEFVFKSFIKIKKCLNSTWETFDSVVNELTSFAQSALNFYVLRLLEVTYKILDNRLLTEDKVDSRIDNLENAYNRFVNGDSTFYELACQLIEPNDLIFYVSAEKFLDMFSRTTKCDKLKVINLHSESGFQIGEFTTTKKDLRLALVDLNEEYQNTINGKFLKNFETFEELELGCKLSINTGIIPVEKIKYKIGLIENITQGEQYELRI